MKGKGKGKDQCDSKECPLQFPDFSPIDHSRLCPRYTIVLQRGEEEGIGIEDLDALQLELETLLVSVTKRRHQLEQEMQILITWQDKKDKKTAGKVQPESTGKRSRPPEGKPTKKYKDGSGKAHPGPTGVGGGGGAAAAAAGGGGAGGTGGGGGGGAAGGCAGGGGSGGRTKSKNIQAKLQEYEFTDSPLEVPRLPKNDAPNRFWASVEPYCAEITQDDIKVLEDLIKSHDEDIEYYKVPALGKHYSLKWEQEDMIEEQKEGAKINDRRRGFNNSSINSADADKLLKKVEKDYESDDASPFGALTQRLVSCLIEENLMTSLEDVITDTNSKGFSALHKTRGTNSRGSGASIFLNNILGNHEFVDIEIAGAEACDGTDGNTSPPPTKGNFIKSLNIGNTVQLEKRIRRELEEQGILEVDDVTSEIPDDEILTELRKCQAELKAIGAHNLSQAKKLLKLAKEEITKQEIKKKLQVADAEVMEAYRRIMAARQKKRSPTKKEKDQAWKALRERENILKQLDSISHQIP